MARAIDANRLKDAIYTDFWEHFTQCHDSDQTALIDMVMDDIDEMPTLTQPNEALTLEQLREMDGGPVWVVVSQNWRESGIKSGWRLVKFHINDDRIRLYMFDTHFGASFFAEQDMGRSYWVYRRPPEGEV